MKIAIISFMCSALFGFSTPNSDTNDSREKPAEKNEVTLQKVAPEPFIKGYPIPDGITIRCYLYSPGICVAIIREPRDGMDGHYQVPLSTGTVDLYGELQKVGSGQDYDEYEVK